MSCVFLPNKRGSITGLFPICSTPVRLLHNRRSKGLVLRRRRSCSGCRQPLSGMGNLRSQAIWNSRSRVSFLHRMFRLFVNYSLLPLWFVVWIGAALLPRVPFSCLDCRSFTAVDELLLLNVLLSWFGNQIKKSQSTISR